MIKKGDGTVITISLQGDPGNPRTLKGIGEGVRKTQREAQKTVDVEAAKAAQEAEKRAERQERLETKALIERERRAKRAADVEIKEAARVESETAKNLTTRQRRIEQADRQQLQRGTVMAREYDKQIADQERTSQRFQQAAERRHARRDRSGQIGGARMIGGGLQLAKGAAQLYAANQISGAKGEEASGILGTILNIEGGYNSARGVYDNFSGLANTRIGRGMTAGARKMGGRAAGGLLSGAGKVAGSLGLELGAGAGVAGAGTLLGAGAAAAGGLAVGGLATFQTGRDIGRYGFMGGSDPNSFVGKIGGAEANALQGVASYMPNWVNNLGMAANKSKNPLISYSGASIYGAAADANKQGAKADRIKAAGDKIRADQAILARNEKFREAEQAPLLDYEMGRRGRALGSELEGIGSGTGSARDKNTRMIAASQKYQKDASMTEMFGATKDRKDAGRSEHLAGLQTELALTKERGGIEKQIAETRKASFKEALSKQIGERDTAKGGLQAFGRMGAGDRARAKSVLERYKKEGSANMSPEDMAIVDAFGGKDAKKKLAAEAEARGVAELGPESGLVGDKAKADKGIAGDFNSNISVSINVQRGIDEQLAKINKEIEAILKAQAEQQAKEAATRNYDASQAGSRSGVNG